MSSISDYIAWLSVYDIYGNRNRISIKLVKNIAIVRDYIACVSGYKYMATEIDIDKISQK